MQLEIHWPEGIPMEEVDTLLTESADDSVLLHDILQLSFTYDVIIDNGVVTFVEKE